MVSLRVISGKARGRKLRSVPGDATRPITARAKAALFDILGPDLRGASFLDLFAGTGSVGIEALSRGALFVRFLDIQHRAIETIQANLKLTGFEGYAEVLRQNAIAMLELPADRTFDYVFIAPPQYKGIWSKTVQILDHHTEWLSEDAWVIAQIHPVEYEQLSLSNLIEFDRRHYGSVLFVFYQRKYDE